MIFVATNADASANNLGKISIKSIDDVSQETYDIIAAYGNRSLTDDQIIALDDFIIAFNNASWKSKVKRLIIPILGVDNNNPSASVIGTEYSNLYDIITKENGKLVSVAGRNGDSGSPAITFKGGIFVNAANNSANYTPTFTYSPIPFNPKDLMIGAYGKRGTDSNNSPTAWYGAIYPNYGAIISASRFEVGAVDKKTILTLTESEKGGDIYGIFSYNYENSFLKGYKEGVFVESSSVNEPYATANTTNGYLFGDGAKLNDRLGNTIEILTYGTSMSIEEMLEFDTLLRTLSSALR